MNALSKWFRDQTHRAYLYRVATVLGVVLVASGVVTDGQVQTVLLLVGTVLSVGTGGLATVNTSTKKS